MLNSKMSLSFASQTHAKRRQTCPKRDLYLSLTARSANTFSLQRIEHPLEPGQVQTSFQDPRSVLKASCIPAPRPRSTCHSHLAVSAHRHSLVQVIINHYRYPGAQIPASYRWLLAALGELSGADIISALLEDDTVINRANHTRLYGILCARHFYLTISCNERRATQSRTSTCRQSRACHSSSQAVRRD
ncbi:hypothetical protein BDR04DRAFT_525852 [Suillus decipiens]|nr:hypothetical protein BDR04DRAFT_611290 [Suillus decipiens]KAG2063249.1 hypothetical protein BDR04DRAFT_525852 [Suillus decipiens]